MNNIKNTFSIKDLENISGIKAHTIRIWEKRYELLSPERTDTNIRFYSIKSLQKLLNVALLNNNGYKVSKIAALSEEEILEHSRKLVSEQAVKNQFVNDMKIAMLNFDQYLFQERYKQLALVLDFKTIFANYFIPFLNELGLLWQTDSINPAHEHFITNLVRQKVLMETEKLNGRADRKSNGSYILFLPDNEIHDLGLCYLNYELMCKGYDTVFLGPSVPLESLKAFIGFNEKITYVSYFTVAPTKDKIDDYVTELIKEIIEPSKAELWLLGCNTALIDEKVLTDSVTVYKSIKNLLEKLG